MNSAASARSVVVLGASTNPDRYSNQAVSMLKEYGHTAIPVHPSGRAVHGLPTLRTLGEVRSPVHTISLYLGPKNSAPLIADIVALKPARIIMNPGSESSELKSAAEAHGIEVVEGCTLVMLRTAQF